MGLFVPTMILEIVSSLSVIAVTLYGLQALIGHLRFRHEINKLPGLSGLPLIGDALVLKSDPAGESECKPACICTCSIQLTKKCGNRRLEQGYRFLSLSCHGKTYLKQWKVFRIGTAPDIRKKHTNQFVFMSATG